MSDFLIIPNCPLGISALCVWYFVFRRNRCWLSPTCKMHTKPKRQIGVVQPTFWSETTRWKKNILNYFLKNCHFTDFMLTKKRNSIPNPIYVNNNINKILTVIFFLSCYSFYYINRTLDVQCSRHQHELTLFILRIEILIEPQLA